MQKNLDLRQKKVIDIETAELLGSISDMDIDISSGKIRSVSVSKGGFSRFIHESREAVFGWDEVVAIGSEYILVKSKKIQDKC